MEDMKVFNYNDTPITFDTAAATGTMINATEMAKPFKKRPNDYLSLPSTKELIMAITKKSGNAENQLIKTIRGGLHPSTWLHEDIALDFAQWLSVDFHLWCNDRIKELLLNGQTNLVRKKEKNVIPGTFFPRIETIGGNTVWTVEYKGDTLYRLKDIMVAIDLYRKSKSWTYKERPYIIRLYDNKGTRTSPYMDKNGVILFIESIREKKRGESWRKFKKDFTLYLRGENKKMIALTEIPDNPEVLAKNQTTTPKEKQKPIDFLKEQLKDEQGSVYKLLNCIVNINDREDRVDLFELLRS